MSDGLTIPRGERNVLRVFTLDPTLTAGIDHLSANDPILPACLGVDRLDTSHVEIVDPLDIADLGLAGYLIEGYGAVEAQITADTARLDALRGPVLIASSDAFPEKPVTLQPTEATRLVGLYAEDTPPVRFESLPSAAAEGAILPGPVPAPPDQTMRLVRLVGIAVLVLLAVLILVRLLAR